MKTLSVLVGVFVDPALAGCVETSDFDGSGGLSLGRDVRLRTARQQGLNLADVDSVREYSFGN